MGKGDLFDRGVAPFKVLDRVKELRVFAQRSGDGAQAADVLGMSPACVVPPAIAVRDESGPHRRDVTLPVAGGGR
jgi:hypothetical protein